MPVGAGFDTFDWRVSVATIAADGPFSAFPGIDRTILLLDGDGVRLRSASPVGSLDHLLDRTLVPYTFSGDAPIDCTLLGGQSTDFNLMVRRGRGSGLVTVHRARGEVSAEAGLLLAVGGGVDVGQDGSVERMPAGAGRWWDASATFDIGVFEVDAVLAVVTWSRQT